MTLPLLLPVSAAFDPWTIVRVAPDRLERAFSHRGMRSAWELAREESTADLTAWLERNMATPGRILSWCSLVTEDGLEVRAVVEFNDGQIWRMTYGWAGPGDWRVRKVHRPSV